MAADVVKVSRPVEHSYTWGDPPPRSALREAVEFLVFAVLFVGSLALAAHIGIGRAL